MAVQRFKIALNAARFPLVSTKGNRAVFIPGLDSAPRTPRDYVGNGNSLDYDTAQVLFMQNVVPAAEGLRSVGFRLRAASPGFGSFFDSVIPLRNDRDAIFLLSPAAGHNYVWSSVANTWVPNWWPTIWAPLVVDTSWGDFTVTKVTYAFVDGMSFVCYGRQKSTTNVDMSMLIQDPSTQNLIPATSIITNWPYQPGEIAGISSSSGYLLMYSGLSVAWAKFNGTQFDFSPYANGKFTGSGQQIPESIGGNITAIIGVSGGFIIFTTRNAVAALYNPQNLAAPWTFRGIPGAGGIQTYEQATVEGSLAAIYAYTTAGFQRISLNSSELVFPAASDFIAEKIVEVYNDSTKSFDLYPLSEDVKVKVTACGNRYIVISYGGNEKDYIFALVYDLALERWGKIAKRHTDCFNYSFISLEPTLPFTAAEHAIAFMTVDGEITIADWSDSFDPVDRSAGVLWLGRVQLTRARHTQINRVEVERQASGELWVIPSEDGATDGPAVQMTPILTTQEFRIYEEMVDCKNFQLLLTGDFNLSTIIIEAVPTGQV